ncbi:IS3 family transposase [Nocardia araoensis]|uniref:IS3 family transposase n=1 Tax=Nocardia TaxID=1817 RepID=UPI0012F63CF5
MYLGDHLALTDQEAATRERQCIACSWLVGHGHRASFLFSGSRSGYRTELAYGNAWRTREDAENALFAYIDGWCNTQRIQKKLDWRSPDEYEASYYQQVPAGT